MSNLEIDRDSILGDDGNTISSSPIKKSQVIQSKKWFFTFNNYTDNDIEILEHKFKEICDKYIFEEEIGECGTKHLQGNIWLKKRMRWTEFKLTNKIHWEKTRNEEAALDYCQKDYKEGKGRIWYKGINIRKPVKLITPDRPYQKFILDIISKESNERCIYWFYETIGNVGKSQFSKYLVCNHKAIYIDEGKKTDIMNTVFTEYTNNNPMELFIFDVPRSNGNKVSYKSIESIKSGLIYSPKYEGGSCIFNSPHIIIFSNEMPKLKEMSLDRWHIYNITESYDITKIEISIDDA